MAAGYFTLVYTLIKNTDNTRAFSLSFVFFLGYFTCSFYWVSNALFIEIEQWWWAVPLALFGLPILLSLFPAIFTFLAHRSLFLRSFFIIISLIVADIARGHLFTGFPWNMPAHMWAQTPVAMNLLPQIGFYGLNSLTIAAFTLPAVLLTHPTHLKNYIFVLFLGSATIFAIGLTSKANNTENIALNLLSRDFQTHIIQANIPQKEKWDPQHMWQNFSKHTQMSLGSLNKNDNRPALIIWPETSLSSNFLSYPEPKEEFHRFLENLPENSLLITGYLASDYTSATTSHYNSLAVFNRDGDLIHRTDKHHLVPFGEYIPFNNFIPLGTVTGFEGFQAGKKPETFSLGSLSILPLICYEIIFPQYSRTTKYDPNRLIINLTNDAWYGKTAGPYQHLAHAQFRAKENNTPIIRTASTGITSIINADGQIILSTNLEQDHQISLP